MSIKTSIFFLVVPVLLLLAGLVRASDIDLQTGGTRTTVDADGGINIESGRIRTAISPDPERKPIYDYRHNYRHHYSHHQRSCQQDSYSYHSNRTSSFEGNVTRNYSSTSTTVCQ